MINVAGRTAQRTTHYVTPQVPDDGVDTIAIMYAATQVRAKCIAEAKARSEKAPFKKCEAAFAVQKNSVKSEVFAQSAPIKNSTIAGPKAAVQKL